MLEKVVTDRIGLAVIKCESDDIVTDCIVHHCPITKVRVGRNNRITPKFLQVILKQNNASRSAFMLTLLACKRAGA